MAIGILCRATKWANLSVGGTYAALAVLLIAQRNSIISDGITVNAQIREHITPLAKTIPISVPIFKRMKHNINNPTTVVNADESIDGAAFLMALFAAKTDVSLSVFSCCSCL